MLSEFLIILVRSDRYAVKRLNSGHQRFLKNLPVIERCPLLGGNLK